MIITNNVYYRIRSTIGKAQPESYGILGKRGGIVCRYIYCGQCGESLCIVDVNAINRAINEWAGAGIQFTGMVHSHPNRDGALSASDKRYIFELVRHNSGISENYELYFPVVLPENGREKFVIKGHSLIFTQQNAIISNDIIFRR